MGFRAPTTDGTTSRVRMIVSTAGTIGRRPERLESASSVGRTLGGAPNASVPFTRDGKSAPRKPLAAQRGISAIPRNELPEPSPYAPPGEQALHELLRAGEHTVEDLDALADAHPDYRMPIMMLAAAVRFADGDFGEVTRRQLRRLLDHSADPATHPFFATHLSDTSHVLIPVAPGVSVAMPFSRDAVGLMLADVHRSDGRLDLAIEAVERLTPGPHTTVSLAELYAEADRNGDIIRLTTDVGNDDDATALLLTYRGMAFARTGLFEAARAAFNSALARRNRAPEIRHLALGHRAQLHAACGRYAHARRDIARILADDPAADDTATSDVGQPLTAAGSI